MLRLVLFFPLLMHFQSEVFYLLLLVFFDYTVMKIDLAVEDNYSTLA
jgi:hypothetical protein